MKIRNYRLFIVVLVAVTFTLLTGRGSDALAQVEKQIAGKQEIGGLNSKKSPVKPKEKKARHKQKAAEDSAVDQPGLQKPLDLSMPFKAPEMAIEQNADAQRESINLFAPEKKKGQRPLYLDGQMLMSQEPELDKRKSVDGAGISINLKR